MSNQSTTNGEQTCVVAGCEIDASTRGMCVKHYRRWLRHGDVNTVLKPRGEFRGEKVRACQVADCSGKAVGRGYCKRHYRRYMLYGDPLGAAPPRTKKPKAPPKPRYKPCSKCGRPSKAGTQMCISCWKALPAIEKFPNRERMERARICDFCEGEFVARTRTSRYCSRECNFNAKRTHQVLCAGGCGRTLNRTKRSAESPMCRSCRWGDRQLWTCQRCGKKEMRSRSRFAALYCSVECANFAEAPRFVLDSNGYLVAPWKGGVIREHRWVFESHLGRPLEAHENVHHINGNRTDNRLENLELWSTSQPPGQRAVDKVEWAIDILVTYEPEALSADLQFVLDELDSLLVGNRDDVEVPEGWTVDGNGYLVKNFRGRVVRQHRYVMEQWLGRPLLRSESVHHINGVRTDNRRSNLELWNSGQPPGQRITDKVSWAKDLLALYTPKALAGSPRD